jgi:hypothetical protein
MGTNISELLNKVITSIDKIADEALIIHCSDGIVYKMYHENDCCESVTIEDIIGDLSDLINSPITMAEEQTSDKNPEGFKPEYEPDSFTWTFYKLATAKGYVTIRWYGVSNGYYSESVTFEKIK